jgi:hypothetical protein
MKVKLVNPEHAAGFIDPQTGRSPFLDPKDGAVLATAEVPENTFWTRRILHGELVRVVDAPSVPSQPTGDEPIKPLTTRGGK